MHILFIKALDFPAHEQLISELTLQPVVVVGWEAVLYHVVVVIKRVLISRTLYAHYCAYF